MFSIEQDIIWGDMDSFNHINNTVYFRYFENVRIEYFEVTGINQMMAETQIGPILGETNCRYLKPLTYPDSISIFTQVTTLRTKRFSMEYKVFSKVHQDIVATGGGEIIYVDYSTGKTVEIPEVIRNEIIRVENNKLQIIT